MQTPPHLAKRVFMCYILGHTTNKEGGMKTGLFTLAGAVALSFAFLMTSGCAGEKMAAKTDAAAVVNSGIKGQVLVESEGAEPGVFVYAYESPFNDLRVPTKLISAPSGPDGSYTLNLKPGSYYIVARKRVSGDPKGYLVKGDYEGKYPANPVEVKDGAFTDVNISVAKLEGNFLLAPYLPEKGEMGIKGTVYDEGGAPAKGAYILLYTDNEMIGLPAYLSKPTDKDGAYDVYLPKPGTYYLAARLKYGGLPRKGEPYGTYDKDPEHKVVVGEKEIITGVDVKLGPFPHDLTKPTK